MYLQFQDIIDVQSSAESLINNIAANATAIFSNDDSRSFIESNLGIPVSGSVTAGFVLGLQGEVR